MTTTTVVPTVALRPIGYRSVGDKMVPFYSVDPAVETIMSNVKNSTAVQAIDHLFALKRIRAEAVIKAETSIAAKQ